ncbi:MAG: DNA primase [Desulfurococcaceae archaeon]
MPVRLNYMYYPFAASPRDYPKLFIEKPSIVVLSSDLKEKLLHVLKSIIERGDVPVEAFSNPEECVLVYNALLDVAKFLGEHRLINRIALAYSKSASRKLEREKDEVLVAVANKLEVYARLERMSPPCLPVVMRRGRRSRVGFTPHMFTMPVAEYLNIVSRRLVHDPAYLLVNNIVNEGYVFLNRQKFKRILEELIFQAVVRQIDLQVPPVTEEFKKLIEEVKPLIAGLYNHIHGKRAIPSYDVDVPREVVEGLFPPCIRRIVDIIDSGGNPSHFERFNLAAFLGSVGLDVDGILEYFKRTADFNERVARYQVEHILGLRGGKKKYKPYNCDRMKATGMCPVNEHCPGGKNPLAVYKHNLKEARKTSSKST